MKARVPNSLRISEMVFCQKTRGPRRDSRRSRNADPAYGEGDFGFGSWIFDTICFILAKSPVW
jgi:hypothetical protein